MNFQKVEITETHEHGVVFKCFDVELADQFEDFLSEHCFVLFNLKIEGNETVFYFGQAASTLKIRSLYEKFLDFHKY